MSNYVKSTDFAAKDALTTGNPLKLIKGTEINDEFNNLQTAIATKADLSSPTLSGNPTAPTQAIGNNSTRLANTAFVQQEIADAEAAIAITGGTISGTNVTDVIITDADISGLLAPIAVADGGTGNSTLTANSVLLGNGTGAVQQVSPATAGNVIRTNGTTWQSQNNLLSASAQNSTSGTSIDFTGIPSWVKRITVMFNGVSTNGTSNLQIQLGDSGGIETSGYIADGFSTSTNQVGNTNYTSGFGIGFANQAAASLSYGSFTITNLSGNIWTIFGAIAHSTSATTNFTTGAKTLSDVLTQIRITSINGTDTFDAGSINIMYE